MCVCVFVNNVVESKIETYSFDALVVDFEIRHVSGINVWSNGIGSRHVL